MSSCAPRSFLEGGNLLADRRLPRSKLPRATAEKLPLSTTRTNILMPSSRSIQCSAGECNKDQERFEHLFRLSSIPNSGSTCGDAPASPRSRSGADTGSRGSARSRTLQGSALGRYAALEP